MTAAHRTSLAGAPVHMDPRSPFAPTPRMTDRHRKRAASRVDELCPPAVLPLLRMSRAAGELFFFTAHPVGSATPT